MKINKAIYSFWTKPYLEHGFKSGGEFYTEEGFYSSWTLSVMNASKHFDKVELYIDTPGWEMLKPFNLPFTKVHIILDELDKYNSELWSIGKIYSYRLQNEPFVHVDSDVYLWEGLPDEYQKSEILVQNSEQGYAEYERMLIDYIERYWGKSDIIDDFITRNGLSKIISFNCGVFGGTNVDFINRYSKEAINFADVINEKFKTDQSIKYCTPCFFEQSILAMMLEKENIFPSLVIDGSKSHNPNFRYTHLAASAKKSKEADVRIKRRISMDHPGSYDLIKQLIKK
jgi:hypothetical protein